MKSANVVGVPKVEGRKHHANTVAGHVFERWIVKWFRGLGFPHVVTSRSESRSRDNDQIDVLNKDEYINGRLPYNVQGKCYASTPDYSMIFEGGDKWVKLKKDQNGMKVGDKVKKHVKPMPRIKGVVNIVMHKLTKKDDITGIFNSVGTYVTMSLEDFEIMVKDRLELEKLKKEVYSEGNIKS